MMVQVMSTAASTKMMAVSINVTGIPTPGLDQGLICYIKIVSNAAFTVTVKLMQTSSYVAYRNQQRL